jgi:hypothetical protein
MSRVVPIAATVAIALGAATAGLPGSRPEASGAPTTAQRFSEPTEVAGATDFHRGFVVASDAAGRLTVATRTPGDALRLIERPAGGRWSDVPLAPGVASHADQRSLAAAGDGALAVAWHAYRRGSPIGVAVRDPGAALGELAQIPAAGAGGVGQPAVAIDAAGDVLLAYDVATDKAYKGRGGAIAVAYRSAGAKAFGAPTVVDRAQSTEPVVALASDGTGIVAWGRGTGGTLMAVSIGRRGAVGRARPFARHLESREVPIVAAGPRSAASIAYVIESTSVIHGTRGYPSTLIGVLARAPGSRAFQPKPQTYRAAGYGVDARLSLASDEEGRTTLAWGQKIYPHGVPQIADGPLRPDQRLWTMTAHAGRPFGRRHPIEPHGDIGRAPIAIDASHGHVALAWSVESAGATRQVVLGAAGRWNQPLIASVIAQVTRPLSPVAVAISGNGHASAFWTAPNTPLLVSDGP